MLFIWAQLLKIWPQLSPGWPQLFSFGERDGDNFFRARANPGNCSNEPYVIEEADDDVYEELVSLLPAV